MTCIEKVPKFVQIWTIFLSSTFSSDISGIQGNLFHNKYSHICFADILLVKHFPVCNFLILTNLINQFAIIYNYILILFNQTKINLSIFFNNWVNRRKRNFFCQQSRVVVYGVEYCRKYIFICTIYTVLIRLIVAFLYELTWAHGSSNSREKPTLCGT